MSQEEYKFSDKFYGQELLHTPAGVRDIYGAECARKKKVQSAIHQMIASYGFRDIQTPAFEFFDIFSKERGSVQSNAMFKFFDRGNNTLVLRPDITPSIARCVSKYYREEQMQIRLCYEGDTYVNTTPYHGKLQEVTQLGAELVNDDSSDADAEMVALTVECLLESGLKEFQIEAGHADFLRGLAEEAGFASEEETKLRELIESKNFFGMEEFLDSLTVSVQLKEIFLKLPELLEDFTESMAFVKARTQSPRVLKALDRLEKLQQIMELYGFDPYVTIDLSMMSQYSYYTGVIFKAYTYGNGEALASGGRYDVLLSQFGKDAPAIGMCITVDQLMLALERQNLLDEEVLGGTILLYETQERAKALALAKKLREEGKMVQMMRKSSHKEMDIYQEYAARMGLSEILYVKENEVLKY